jgi:hypothetical protein
MFGTHTVHNFDLAGDEAEVAACDCDGNLDPPSGERLTLTPNPIS